MAKARIVGRIPLRELRRRMYPERPLRTKLGNAFGNAFKKAKKAKSSK